MIGGFVADAASMPLQLIYDQSLLSSLCVMDISESCQLEFHSQCLCPFYSIQPGHFSPIGDEAVPLLRSVVNKGYFDSEAAKQEKLQHYRDHPGKAPSVLLYSY